jgi:hypothetical protein
MAMLHTVPDFLGDGQTHSLAEIMTLNSVLVPVPPHAAWIGFDAINQGSTAIRVGDSTVGPNIGLCLNSQTGNLLPPVRGESYRLDEVFVYVPTGDSLSITYCSSRVQSSAYFG